MRIPFIRRKTADPDDNRPSKILTMTTAKRLSWVDRGTNTRWEYAAELPSGNFSVVFSEFDRPAKMGFVPKGSTIVTHEEPVDPEVADDLYEAINRSIYGDNWNRAKRVLDAEL